MARKAPLNIYLYIPHNSMKISCNTLGNNFSCPPQLWALLLLSARFHRDWWILFTKARWFGAVVFCCQHQQTVDGDLRRHGSCDVTEIIAAWSRSLYHIQVASLVFVLIVDCCEVLCTSRLQIDASRYLFFSYQMTLNIDVTQNFSALLTILERNPTWPVNSPHQGTIMWCFHVLFVVSINKSNSWINI